MSVEPAAAGADAPASRSPFASPGFARWWLGSLVAGTGIGIQSVTVPLFVRDRVEPDVRALAIAGALVAQALPAALFALVGGAVADRVERRRILVRSYGVAAAVSVLYVALSLGDVRSIWPVFPLAAAVGSAGAFTNPARASLLPQLVTRAQLQNGVILGTMGFMAAFQFAGPSVAGLTVDTAGLTSAFALEVALLLASAAVFGGLRTGPVTPTGRPVLHDLRDGVRYAARHPALRALLPLALVPGLLFNGPFAVTIALVVPDTFHAPDKWVGLLWGCFGAGVFAGSLLLTWRPLPRRGLALCLSNVAGGVTLVAYGLSESLPLSAALLVVWGLGGAVFMNYVVTLLQEHAEPAMMGRVMSMYSFAFFVSLPAGYALAGLLTRLFDPATTLVASGVAATAVGVAMLLFARTLRALD